MPQASKSGVLSRLLSAGFVALVLVVLLLAALLLGRQDYVPTAQRLRGLCPEFLVLAEELTGVSGNTDTDSAIFTYRTTAGEAARFWSQLDGQLTAGGWALIDDDPSFRSYERVVDDGDMGVVRDRGGASRVGGCERNRRRRLGAGR